MTLSTLFRYTPTIGICLFLGLFYYSAQLYPGGSQADLVTIGFDWMNNYWCNLTAPKAMNGVSNPARPYAISGHIILCLSLTVFFIQFSKSWVTEKSWRRIIQVSGSFSMISAVFMFTGYHDSMTTIASLFGVLAVFGIIRALYQSEQTGYKLTGAFCLILLAINNYIYYTLHGIDYLPVIQKISLLFILVWVSMLNFKMSRNG